MWIVLVGCNSGLFCNLLCWLVWLHSVVGTIYAVQEISDVRNRANGTLLNWLYGGFSS